MTKPFSIHMVLGLYYCAVVFSLASVKYWVLVVCGWWGQWRVSQQQSAAATVQFTLSTSRHCTSSYFPSSPPHLLGERKLYELFW